MPEALLSLTQRRRADHLAIEVEEVEQEEDEGAGVAKVRSCLNDAKRGLPVRTNAAELPIEIRLLCRQNRHALATGEYLCVQSRPVRVSNETLPRSRRACMRWPSYLISCSHTGPCGGASTSLQSCGLTQLGSPVGSPRRLLFIDFAITASGSSSPHDIPSEMLD